MLRQAEKVLVANGGKHVSEINLAYSRRVLELNQSVCKGD